MSRPYKYSPNSLRHINGVQPDMRSVCHLAMVIANSRMMNVPDFGISCGHRTQLTQKDLYAIGRTVDTHLPTVTNCDGVKTKSRHQSGNAVDIYCYVDGKTNYKMKHLAQVATCFYEAAMQLGVTLKWGGQFENSVDAPHFEIVI
ncbi:MAG: M15 family metallopeptidase [Pseudoalteromonas sp.]|uniref:M15 family metallopeptidase n=1 Tax=Pseudoalteromonas sp. TaxID=53249 RepID=UPI001D7EB866|nr:M15 family metallopeptidase [Pseudoalteromonas sp.]NRA77162.1 M15 family metallopeptidase [Pseudoalteromonas sp.]